VTLAACLETARRLALEGATIVQDLRHQPLNKQRKADRSLVTEADLQSDQVIRSGLEEAFPTHVVLSEESGLGDRPDAEFVWLVDPLDGTKAYAKGIAGFSVMIGLLQNQQPVLGVVVDPLENLVYEAVRGQGAFLFNGMQRIALHVSERRDFGDMPLVVSTGFPTDKMEQIRPTLSGPLLPPINSVGIKVGLVVRQEADIYINHHPVHLWDTCAPQIILEEAGGRMTRLDGKPLGYELTAPFSHQSLTLATNGSRHDEISSLLTPLLNPAR